MSTDAQDLAGDPQSCSNCCGARITMQGLCSDCGEHCEDERDTEPSEAQLERMNASAFAAQEKRVLAEDQIERDCRDAGRPSPFRP